jgi:hypothetical protein
VAFENWMEAVLNGLVEVDDNHTNAYSRIRKNERKSLKLSLEVFQYTLFCLRLE